MSILIIMYEDFMILLYLLLIIVLILIIIDFTLGFRLNLLAGLDEKDMFISIKCMYPFLYMLINVEDDIPYLYVYLFKIRIYRSKLKKSRKLKTKKLLKSADTSDFNIKSTYGFKDPSTTGFLYGVFGIITGYVDVENIEISPDFMSDTDYIHMDASTNLKIGHTIINYFKNK